MQHIRIDTMCFLHNSTRPIGRKIRATDKKDREEERERPDDDDEDHKPSDDVEAGSGVAGEDAPVEEDEGEFDEAESGDLEELAGQEGLVGEGENENENEGIGNWELGIGDGEGNEGMTRRTIFESGFPIRVDGADAGYPSCLSPTSFNRNTN
ncbi:hypothetical protein BPOR_0088g00140 [Botrytis porri]|uniref:Uncharacterized protein n=1 Tax=Botrytis porri TaxID=87229 RepID=A0A4Z1KZE6_9HELO|nr:hypothetical protein BPOR_0088g00140 [Botrytis porri]